MSESSKDSRFAASGQSLQEAPRQSQLLAESPFLKACRKEKTAYTPIWLMRQAGRYMKEFREIRSKVGFLELCKNPALAAEVTVHAQETLGVDAAIIFADILLPLDAFNVGLEFVKGEGPQIARPLRTQEDLAAIPELDAADALSYVLEAIKMTRSSLKADIPLIGFAAAPFTLASYLIEGGSSRNYENTKTMFYSRPELWQALMKKLVSFSIDYLNAQVDAGAQALQIFDSWVGCLSPQDYKEFVLPYSKSLIKGLKAGVPVIHFGTGSATLLPLMKEAGADVLGLDWRVDFASSRESLQDIAVQGNLDPCVLLAEPEFIKKRTLEIMRAAKGKAGHIFNLGHGILPPTNPDNVKYLVEIVHNYKED
ncbi:MAG: uroporphyrinogen decarboxylase [Candidatus Obscuribacterales bacterium]|nr:uroporphyrinogen decarboxylase [Candidatus Obscuribacterales bacterium]